MKWILIDLSYLAHRARHSFPDLMSEDIPTGVLFGFFEQLYTICNNPRFSSNRVLIFKDSKKSYRRRSFPDYKKHRRNARKSPLEIEESRMMHKQMEILSRIWLPRMGFPVYSQVGVESDDLMAAASKTITKRKESGVMITSDSDLFQCITPNVVWFDPQRDILLDVESFKEKYEISVKKWGSVKAIGGCRTDGVPGILGVSEKGAIDFILGRLPKHHKKYQKIKGALESGDIEFWKSLVVLPHRKTKRIVLSEPEYDPDMFFDFCEKFDMYSYLNDGGKIKWSRFFEGKFPANRKRRKHGTERKGKLFRT